jgi:hypothetical protein
MELFKPSNKILEMICSDGNSVQRNYEIFPFGTHEEMSLLCGLYISGIYGKLLDFYRVGLEENRKRFYFKGTYNIFGEIFKNWIDHSPEDLDLMTGLFLGDKVFVMVFTTEVLFSKT